MFYFIHQNSGKFAARKQCQTSNIVFYQQNDIRTWNYNSNIFTTYLGYRATTI